MKEGVVLGKPVKVSSNFQIRLSVAVLPWLEVKPSEYVQFRKVGKDIIIEKRV